MISNFIGGGQVFLHKVRMLRQVVGTTIFVSLLAGFCLTWSFSSNNTTKFDLDGAATYAKAKLALAVHPALSAISIGKSKANVDAYSEGKLWKKRMLASSIIASSRFKSAWDQAILVSRSLILKSLGFGSLAGSIVFLLWSKFGRDLKTERKNDGSGIILTPKQVKIKLKRLKLCSEFYIGEMPLVKDMETRHFLITGSTGSGKTNLIHNLLPQVEQKKQPAIIIDQTGEMIAKYYDQKRGDIIFNPFDERAKAWDFWTDCSKARCLEKFVDTLIGFNSRKNNRNAADFWEEAAQSIFVEVVSYLQKHQQYSLQELRKTICQSDHKELRRMLQGTDCIQYFTKDNAKAASSIMSVLMTNIKPLRFLHDQRDAGSFSVQEYIKKIDEGFGGWLFLASEPSTRELTISLNASLAELAIANLMRHDSLRNRRIWFIMDELAAFGRFPSLAKLMQEGRKYGTCVVAGLQSSSQLFAHYGSGEASNLFALFKTKFAFQSDDPMMGKLYSSICGSETVTRQQKNTSFGANTFRDGISYNEQQQEKPLVKLDDFASLGIGECYTLLPIPEVRLSKMQTPEAKRKDKNPGFVEAKELEEIIESSDPSLLEQDDDDYSDSDNINTTDNQDSIELFTQKQKELEPLVIDDQSSSKIKQPSSSVTNTKNQKSITKKEEVEFDELEI
ncbi:Type IV secretion-system coupling protein DNA-binding domain (plasmid) [Candidatus Trichorickettsia mobilis]|uniref:type IV secretion system DNA-binding domain-containing protein n=1 Tax=Candidatus Trichorickettsia mobilis TaxID=1346319 RepID=UPI002B259113|nr:type IV secretion system DNA-binding domain-containing protein [Candidatus Trichorickettsia mobilis]WPY01582.1 Type IV secretion-system coupling protein DNA-binding domain [Candidatus Trichorickettsia mobilis]